jgi:hypothetical protein
MARLCKGFVRSVRSAAWGGGGAVNGDMWQKGVAAR